MPSLTKIAPRDQVRQFVMTFKNDDGEREDVHLEYYRNRISLAPMEALISEEDAKELSDAELDALRAASTMCYYIKSWDVTGELKDYQGNVLVAEGDIVPLDPRMTQYMPTPIIGEIMRKLTEEVFPDAGKSRNERRRSR
jgi:hypothetical protein